MDTRDDLVEKITDLAASIARVEKNGEEKLEDMRKTQQDHTTMLHQLIKQVQLLISHAHVQDQTQDVVQKVGKLKGIEDQDYDPQHINQNTDKQNIKAGDTDVAQEQGQVCPKVAQRKSKKKRG